LLDAQGINFADALRTYGKDPARIADAAIPAGDAAAFLEVHIEQGPVLEAEKQPLGVVTAIVGQTRLQITLTGEAGHAGTVPMNLRRDAFAGAAETALMVEKLAQEFVADKMVATVGKVDVLPGAANIIPGVARFTLDLRTESDKARNAAIDRFEREVASIANRRNLGIAIDPIHRIDTTPCNADLLQQLAQAVTVVGAKPVKIPSGAGHDGLMMSELCPIAMLFVRCKGGISHNPAEYASPNDMGIAIAALVKFIEQFKPARAAG
jgi:allantoate deiminase